MLKIESSWNTLVNKSCTSPFLLTGFVKQWIDSTRYNEWTPLLIIFLIDNNVSGLVALATKKKCGIRSAKFLHAFTHQPDFIVSDQYRELFIGHTIDFLFKELNCKFVDFSLDVTSPSMKLIEQHCKKEKIFFSTVPKMGHNILKIFGDWETFKSQRGRNFRKQIKKMTKNFNCAGSWDVVSFQGNIVEVRDKILSVEKQSWKEKWRILRGENVDPNLLLVLEGAHHTAKIEPRFEWKVYFLILDKQVIAYYVVFQYKENAFFLKTSYDDRYKKLHPGSFLRYSVVREFFKTEEIKCIDFITDLPHHRKWTSVRVPRVRVTLTNGLLPKIWKRVFGFQHPPKIMFLLNSVWIFFNNFYNYLS